MFFYLQKLQAFPIKIVEKIFPMSFLFELGVSGMNEVVTQRRDVLVTEKIREAQKKNMAKFTICHELFQLNMLLLKVKDKTGRWKK